MTTVAALLSVIGALWLYNSGRLGAIWGAMTGTKKLVGT